ncbi:MAG: hypothetical protein FJ121_08995 [Deltaproteobacteria bacterium]|nr:hypothetical protein [Deltaproteobacteria bacterium]
MTFPRLRELGSYWRRYPPAHVQMARLMSGLAGLADGPAPADGPGETATLQEFIADWQALGGLMA